MVVYVITTKISIFVSYYISVKETEIDLFNRNIYCKTKHSTKTQIVDNARALGRVRTKLECPSSLNLKTKIQGLESP